MFWIYTACLFVLATLFVIVPLWRRRKVQSFESETVRDTANIALFHERANDLEAELATGDIDQDQYDRLMLELQQNLLADVSDEEREALARQRLQASASDVTESDSGKFGFSFAIPVVLAVLIPAAAYLLYERWGYFDDVVLMDYFERTVNNPGDPEEARELIVALGEAVQADEDQPWAWYFLGENFANIGMFNEAQIAYQRAAQILDDRPEKAVVLGRVALAMYINAELNMTEEIRDVIAEARELNANETSVLQLLASDAEQNEDWEAAISYWRLLIQQDPNSEQAQVLRQSIAAAQAILNEDAEPVASPVIELSLSLAEDLQLDPRMSVFIAARNADREGMPPLAALRLQVADLPGSFVLDNSSAVGAFNLGSAERVILSALVSRAGTATPQTGDYRVISDAIDLNPDAAVAVELVISDQVQ